MKNLKYTHYSEDVALEEVIKEETSKLKRVCKGEKKEKHRKRLQLFLELKKLRELRDMILDLCVTPEV